MKKKLSFILIFAFLLAFILSSCGEKPISPENTAQEAENVEPADETPSYSVIPGKKEEAVEETVDEELPEGDEEPVQEEIPPEPTQEELEEMYIDELVSSMTDAELAGQLVFCGCPQQGAAEFVERCQPAGLILFGYNIDGETRETLSNKLADYQSKSKIPLLIGVDEEGGTVARVSAFPAFRASRFSSPRKLIENGGVDALRAETEEKASLLSTLGINVNLAPVCDLAKTQGTFMYSRALPGTTQEVCEYVKEIVTLTASGGVGTVLKHFPGYGECGDTHTAVVTDSRARESFYTDDFRPFTAGVEAGSGAVLVSHNIVPAFDAENPASLSAEMLKVLREELGEDLVVMTDDLEMDAVASRYSLGEAAVKAILAGEDIALCSNGEPAVNALAQAMADGTLSRERAEESVRRVLAWKMKIGLISM